VLVDRSDARSTNSGAPGSALATCAYLNVEPVLTRAAFQDDAGLSGSPQATDLAVDAPCTDLRCLWVDRPPVSGGAAVPSAAIGCRLHGHVAVWPSGANRTNDPPRLLAGRAALLVLEGVTDVEGLVGDEERGHVAILGGAVLHEHAFREPDEVAWAEDPRVRL
jgi:hypothetical protein